MFSTMYLGVQLHVSILIRNGIIVISIQLSNVAISLLFLWPYYHKERWSVLKGAITRPFFDRITLLKTFRRF